MRSLSTHLCTEKRILYDGSQLAPHWIYRTFDIMDDAVVAFQGPADVALDHMVDLEDVKKKAPIGSPLMLHFIAEWFQDSLENGILLQHLFVCEIYETLLEKGITGLSRRGNDIYYQGRKFSVSIATRSPVSVLMHTAVNVDTEGTPVPTSGLREMSVDAEAFAAAVMERFRSDGRVWRAARVKVLPR
jgi:hypothetical protein